MISIAFFSLVKFVLRYLFSVLLTMTFKAECLFNRHVLIAGES